MKRLFLVFLVVLFLIYLFRQDIATWWLVQEARQITTTKEEIAFCSRVQQWAHDGISYGCLVDLQDAKGNPITEIPLTEKGISIRLNWTNGTEVTWKLRSVKSIKQLYLN